MEENNINDVDNIDNIDNEDTEYEEHKKIEEEIKSAPVEPIEEKTEEEKQKILKLPKRKQMILTIKDISKRLGIDCNNREIDRMKIKQLELKLVELTKQAYSKHINIQMTKNQNNAIVKNDENRPAPETVIRGLYNATWTGTKIIGRITKYMGKNETFGDMIPSLEGYEKTLDDYEVEVKACLREVFEKYGNVVKDYVDPLYMLALTVGVIGFETGLKNCSEPLEQSKTKSNAQ